MSYVSIDIWHISVKTYGDIENRQDISNAAIGFKVIQKTFSCKKNWKNLGIPFPPLRFLKSFVKVIRLVADHFSSYIKNTSSSLIYTYSSMRKLKITIEKSYFCIFDLPYSQVYAHTSSELGSWPKLTKNVSRISIWDWVTKPMLNMWKLKHFK